MQTRRARRGPLAPRGDRPAPGGHPPRDRGRALDGLREDHGQRTPPGGQARGPRQRVPLRGRGARAAGPRHGREHPHPRHRGPEGPPALVALGAGRHRGPQPARHPEGRHHRAGAPGPGRGRAPLPHGQERRPHRPLRARGPLPSTCPSCVASWGSTRRRGATARSAREPCSTTCRTWRPRSRRCSSCPRETCAWSCAGSGEVLLLGEAPHRQRVLTFLSLRKDLVERCPDAEYFDLRFRGRIYAKQPAPPPAGAASRRRRPPAAHPASPARPRRPRRPLPRPAWPLPPPRPQPPPSAAAEPPRDDQGR